VLVTLDSEVRRQESLHHTIGVCPPNASFGSASPGPTRPAGISPASAASSRPISATRRRAV